jgi:hypothetical protein
MDGEQHICTERRRSIWWGIAIFFGPVVGGMIGAVVVALLSSWLWFGIYIGAVAGLFYGFPPGAIVAGLFIFIAAKKRRA